MSLRPKTAALPAFVLLSVATTAIVLPAVRLAYRLEAATLVCGEGIWVVAGWLGLGMLGILLLVLRELATLPRVGSFAMVRGFVYCLLPGVVVYLVAMQPFAHLTAELTIGCAAAAWAVLAVSWDWIGARLPNGLRRWSDILLCNLCLLAIGGELGLRLLARLAPSPLLVVGDALAVQRVAAHKFRPGEPYFGYRANSLGFYDEEFLPPERRRGPMVAVIGDSFVAGIVPLHHHFTTVAERELGGDVRVYSVGVSATGFPEYEHLLRAVVLPLRPQAVILSIFVGNDFIRDMVRREASPRLRDWFDRDRVLLSVVPRRLFMLATAGRELGSTGAAHAGPPVVGDPGELATHWPWIVDWRLEPAKMPPDVFLDLEKRIANNICVPGNAAFDAGLEFLLAMRRAAGSIPFGVIVIPDEFQVEDALWAEVAVGLPPEADRFQAQRIIAEFVRRHDIPCLDLLPVLRAVPTEHDGSRHLYHLRDTHLNVAGNLHTGQAMAAFVRALLRRDDKR